MARKDRLLESKNLKWYAKALDGLISEDEVDNTKSRTKRIRLAYARNRLRNLAREMRLVSKQLTK